MTEQEKINSAKNYIQMLANGINPIDGSIIPDSDVVNNVHITRCLFYVADLLDAMIDDKDGEKSKKTAVKARFIISDEQASEFEFSNTPVSASVIARRLTALVDSSKVKRLTYRDITSWLVRINMLEERIDDSGIKMKQPTEEGCRLGITTQRRLGRDNVPYSVVVYSREAQQFIVDNIQAITAFI